MRIVFVLGFAIALTQFAGCATTPNSGSSQFQAAAPKAGFGAVYVGRPFGWNTSVIPLEIELDGRPLAELGINQYTRIELPPGRYKIGAPNSWRTRSTAGTPHPVEVVVEPGKVYYLLPTRWVENVRPAVTMIANQVVATRTGDAQSSFSIKASAATAEPPPEFLNLSPVAPR